MRFFVCVVDSLELLCIRCVCRTCELGSQVDDFLVGFDEAVCVPYYPVGIRQNFLRRYLLGTLGKWRKSTNKRRTTWKLKDLHKNFG